MKVPCREDAEHGGGSHHDGEGHQRVHAEQIDQGHAGGEQADTDVHQGSEQEVAGKGDPQLVTAQPHGLATEGKSPSRPAKMRPATTSSGETAITSRMVWRSKEAT